MFAHSVWLGGDECGGVGVEWAYHTGRGLPDARSMLKYCHFK